jgi:integrase
MRIATVDQVAAIANRVPPRYRALVLVAASGGLRWGELAGLRRQRVDLERGTVTRRRSRASGRAVEGCR